MLLVYKTRFFTLTLYPLTLLSLLSKLFCRFLRIFYVNNHVIWKRKFTSFFVMTFSLCFIAMARIFNIIMNRDCKNRHPCLVSDLRGKVFNILLLNMILAVEIFFYRCCLSAWRCFLLFIVCWKFSSWC